jgi:hypothetical protein
MNHIIRIQLEHNTDVIRDIEIPSNKSLEDLHYIIIDSLKLKRKEIASFYLTNEKFDLLQEIPLFKIDEEDRSMLEMSNIKIKSVFPEIESKLIYVYDFLKMWRFLISFSEESKDNSNKVEIINSIGEMPEEATEIIFESQKAFDTNEDITNEFDDSEY